MYTMHCCSLNYVATLSLSKKVGRSVEGWGGWFAFLVPSCSEHQLCPTLGCRLLKFSTTYELAVFRLCQAWCIEIYDFIDLHFRFQRFALALDRVEALDLIGFHPTTLLQFVWVLSQVIQMKCESMFCWVFLDNNMFRQWIMKLEIIDMISNHIRSKFLWTISPPTNSRINYTRDTACVCFGSHWLIFNLKSGETFWASSVVRKAIAAGTASRKKALIQCVHFEI